MSTIAITGLALDGKQAGDIAITAAEGGINYWATVDRYDYRRWSPIAAEAIDVAEDFVFYTVVNLRETSKDDPLRAFLPIAVTPALIARGIGLHLVGVPGNFEGRAIEETENGEWEYMDSAAADCVIQLGAFGRLVYG